MREQLQNAKRSLASMRKEAASGATQRVREAIQSRIQLIQTEEISRPVLVSLAAAVAYTHAQRFKLAQDMIGKVIKQNSSVAEIFVVRAHVRYTEGSSCDGETAVRCWTAAVEDCNHALRLNSECWPALWWKAQALSNLSGTSAEGRETSARDALTAIKALLEFQPSFEQQPEFQTAYTGLNRTVMLADASQCIESREYEKSLVITSRLLEASPDHAGALRWRATALGEMLKSTTQRLEPLFQDAVEAEEKILAQTKETDTDHVDALARKTETTLRYMKRVGIAVSAGEDRVGGLFKDLNKALRLDPRHRASLLLRARVNASLLKPDETIADCTKMLESDRKSDIAGGQQRLEALGMRARAFMEVELFREAMADYDNALHICGNTEGLEGVPDQVAALERQKVEADRALQAKVNAAQVSLLETLAKDDAAEASAQKKASAAAKKKKKAKKQRQQDKKQLAEPVVEVGSSLGESSSTVDTVQPMDVDTAEPAVSELVEVLSERVVVSDGASPPKNKRNRNRRKGSGASKGNGNSNNGKAAAEKSMARLPAPVGPSEEQISAAQEQLAALFSDLPVEELEAALVKTGYNVEAACSNIFAGLDGEDSPTADTLAVGTLLEVVDEWEEVSSSTRSAANSRPKSGLEKCIEVFGGAGLKLRRNDLDDACWERLTEVPESMLVESARQYLHRQRMAKRGQGSTVQNKSAFLMSVVHKLSQKEKADKDKAEKAAEKKERSPRGKKKGDGNSAPSSPTKGGRVEAAGALVESEEESPHVDVAVATEELVPAVAELLKSAAVAEVLVYEEVPQEVFHSQDAEEEEDPQPESAQEVEVCFNEATAEEAEEEEEDGGIMFGAAEPEEELMFGAPTEAPAPAPPPAVVPEPVPVPEPVAPPELEVELSPLELRCQSLRKPGYPAGEVEIRALADMLRCRIGLYARRTAAEEEASGGVLSPTETASLAQLESFLPTNISAAYRRAVLIQCNMNVRTTIETIFDKIEDGFAEAESAAADALAAQFAHTATFGGVGKKQKTHMLVWTPTNDGVHRYRPCMILRGGRNAPAVVLGSDKGVSAEMVCAARDGAGDGMFAALARLSDGEIGRIVLDAKVRCVGTVSRQLLGHGIKCLLGVCLCVRAQGCASGADGAKLQAAVAQLRQRCADHIIENKCEIRPLQCCNGQDRQALTFLCVAVVHRESFEAYCR